MVCINAEAAKEQTEQTEQTASPGGAGYKVFSVVRSVLVYLLAAAIIIGALLFASSKSPQKALFGFRYYTVLTPSMEPTYSTGDMVFVKLCGAGEINVGDVITFNPSESGEAYLTHRVTQKFDNYDGTGVTCFRTKGDNNKTEDSFLIDENRVIGVVKFHVPKLGYIVRFVQLRWYFVVPIIALVILFFYLLQLYFTGGEEEEPQTKASAGETSGENVTPASEVDPQQIKKE